MHDDMTTRAKSGGMQLFAAMTLAFSISACSDQSDSVQIERNTNPSASYTLAIKINGAPEPFDATSATAFYEVVNASCAPRMAISGVRDVPNRALDLKLAKSSDHQYQTSFELTPFADGDYFGKGVCHWELTSIGFTGVEERMKVIASFSADELKKGSTQKNYFLKSIFDHASSRLNIGGLLDPTVFAKDAQTFTIEMTAKEATHDDKHR